MKLIQQRKLFFKEGNSDKVYEIELCELSADAYLVNFRYGRRGSALKEGTKTPAALPLDKATLLFASLEMEKRNKGYQTEMEVFVELPSLESVDLNSATGKILQRLQDAVEGKNSFKTEWKTSRVIWKAGYLKLETAIPFILKLATKGDEMQAYASLWALTRLKASQASPLFNTYAFNVKQKQYLRNVAWEGLLTVSETEVQAKLNITLLEQLPGELRYAVETTDSSLLSNYLKRPIQEGAAEYFSVLYLLSKMHVWILPVLCSFLKHLPFRPPYFKQIRAIYKLAQLRNESVVIAILSYRFEKEAAMFKRTSALEAKHKQYLGVIDQLVNVGSELKSPESKLAFSHFTKEYFQKNTVEYLKQKGKDNEAKDYLKLAVGLLLQYSEADYSPAGERPLSEYGQYDYQRRMYSFTLINYPECSESLLLSAILFGNDAQRILQANLKFILGKRIITSQQYSFSRVVLPASENTVQPTNWTSSSTMPVANPKQENNSVIDTALNVFKGLFGKKKAEAPAKVNQPQTEPIPEQIPALSSVKSPAMARLELYPEHWDAMPEAYVQLLMQAKMKVIHHFAYHNLKACPQFEVISNRFDEQALLQLLYSDFELPNQLGFELLENREELYKTQTTLIAKVLDCNSKQAIEWAKTLVADNVDLYLDDLGFLLLLIFNSKAENATWITAMLSNHAFNVERMQAITGKAIAELLHLENTDSNNKIAGFVIERLKLIAGSQLEQISWSIIEQLMESPLSSNRILASEIMIRKSKNISPVEIPLSIVYALLQNENEQVRNSGFQLLVQYPDDFIIRNINALLPHLESIYVDVVSAVIGCIRLLLKADGNVGKKVISHFVYALIRKGKFEGAHGLISQFVLHDLSPYWNEGLRPHDVTKLVHAHYRVSQMVGYEMLKSSTKTQEFTLGQIISFGNHEILAIRQWCWNYFKQNVARIRFEKDKSLALLDSKWEDTRAYAFWFFKTNFETADWDADTLIGIVDTVRPDVEQFGKEMISTHFQPEHAVEYLAKLSEHPSVNVQAFITNYLSHYAAGNLNLLQQLDYYFRSVLARVNKARVAKDRILKFLHQEGLKSETAAAWVVSILDDIVVQSAIGDKAMCIHILTEIKNCYPHLDMHLTIKN